VRRQAVAHTASMDFTLASRDVVLRGAVAGALAAALALAIVSAWNASFLWVLACRMLNPASELAYPTRTTIEVLGGDRLVRWSEPVTLEARAHGDIPSVGRVFVRMRGAGWESAPVAATGEARFQLALPRVTEDVEYYFRLGDAKSRRHQVSVARPPRIVEGRVELRYPPYTRLKSQVVDTLNLKAPEGTTLSWQLKFDRAVLGAEMKREGADAAAMSVSSGGREARLQLPAEASRPYGISVRWRLGDREYVEPGARHYIQVIPDADPQVGLLHPTEDAKATLKKTIGLTYWARDDYGLGEAWIVYSVNDGGELRHPLGALDGRTHVEKEESWPITRLLPSLKRNDIVTFAVEVTDGRPGSPGRGRSISRRVQFVSDGEYVAYMLARQRKFLGQLRPLYLQEKEAAGHLETVGRAAPASTPAAGPGSAVPSGTKERRPR